jgi:hypothetical protein
MRREGGRGLAVRRRRETFPLGGRRVELRAAVDLADTGCVVRVITLAAAGGLRRDWGSVLGLAARRSVFVTGTGRADLFQGGYGLAYLMGLRSVGVGYLAGERRERLRASGSGFAAYLGVCVASGLSLG